MRNKNRVSSAQVWFEESFNVAKPNLFQMIRLYIWIGVFFSPAKFGDSSWAHTYKHKYEIT